MYKRQPLNDPFVGDGSLGGGSGIKVVAESEEEKRNLSVFNLLPNLELEFDPIPKA